MQRAARAPPGATGGVQGYRAFDRAPRHALGFPQTSEGTVTVNMTTNPREQHPSLPRGSSWAHQGRHARSHGSLRSAEARHPRGLTSSESLTGAFGVRSRGAGRRDLPDPTLRDHAPGQALLYDDKRADLTAWRGPASRCQLWSASVRASLPRGGVAVAQRALPGRVAGRRLPLHPLPDSLALKQGHRAPARRVRAGAGGPAGPRRRICRKSAFPHSFSAVGGKESPVGLRSPRTCRARRPVPGRRVRTR